MNSEHIKHLPLTKHPHIIVQYLVLHNGRMPNRELNVF